MSNNKSNFWSSLKKTIFSNFGIKILALVMAVLVFVVVHVIA